MILILKNHMPNSEQEEPKTEIIPKDETDKSVKKITTEERMAMILAELDGDNLPNLTPGQVDKLIEERSKVNGYISKDKDNQHAERMEDRKNDRHCLYVGSVVLIVIFALVLFKKPELLGEALAFLAGGGGGFGLGKYKGLLAKKEENS